MAKKRKVNLGAQPFTGVHEQPDGTCHLDVDMTVFNQKHADIEFVAYKEMQKLVDSGTLPNDRASQAYLNGMRKKIIASGDDPDADYELANETE